MKTKFFTKLFLVLGLLALALVWFFLELTGHSFKLDIFFCTIFVIYSTYALIIGSVSKERLAYKYGFISLAVLGYIIAEVIYFVFVKEQGINASLIVSSIFLTMIAGLTISFIVSKGQPWDMGDNQKPGYKTYSERENKDEI